MSSSSWSNSEAVVATVAAASVAREGMSALLAALVLGSEAETETVLMLDPRACASLGSWTCESRYFKMLTVALWHAAVDYSGDSSDEDNSGDGSAGGKRRDRRW